MPEGYMPYQLIYNNDTHQELYRHVLGGFEWPKKNDIVLDKRMYFKGWFYAKNSTVSIRVTSGNSVIAEFIPNISRADVKHHINIDSPENLGFDFYIDLSGERCFEITALIGDNKYLIWSLILVDTKPLDRNDLSYKFIIGLQKNNFKFETFIADNKLEDKDILAELEKIKSSWLSLTIDEADKIYPEEIDSKYREKIEKLKKVDWSIDSIIESSNRVLGTVTDIFSNDSFYFTQSFCIDDKNIIALTNGSKIFFIIQHSCNICIIYPERFLLIKLSIDPWVDEVIKSLPKIILTVAKFRREGFLEKNSKFLGLNISHSRPYHYFYDQINGLRILDEESTKKFDIFSIHGFNFFDLSNLRVCNSFSSLTEEEINSYTKINGGFLLMPCVQLIPSDSPAITEPKETFSQISEFLLPEKKSNQFEKEISFLEKYNFILWVGISTEKRRWIEQVEGIKNIAIKLKERYIKILILIDGRTFPLTVRNNDLNAAIQDNEILNQLISNSNEVDFYSLIGKTAFEKIIFARKIDIFLSSYATDSMYPSAFSKKPGVVFIAPSIGDQKKLHVHHNILHVPIDKIKETNGKGRAWHETSVSIDWEDIYKCIESKINQEA